MAAMTMPVRSVLYCNQNHSVFAGFRGRREWDDSGANIQVLCVGNQLHGTNVTSALGPPARNACEGVLY